MNSIISRNTYQEILLNKGFTDALKFIAAIMVAFGHYAGHALSFSNCIVYRITVAFAGDVGVAIFFFLSGYGLMMSDKKNHLDFCPFIKRRISKVYLPVVLVSFIWQLILWPEGAGIERIPLLLYATFWGFSDGILWFVKVILGLYLLFYGYVSWKKHIGMGGGGYNSLVIRNLHCLCNCIYCYGIMGRNQYPIVYVGDYSCRPKQNLLVYSSQLVDNCYFCIRDSNNGITLLMERESILA